MIKGIQAIIKKSLGLIAASIILVGSGCTLFDEKEPIPSYLYIEPFTVQTDPAEEGTNSAKVTEVWVNVNNDFLGAYILPALVPVLAEGDAEIVLNAGVRDNGISNTPEIYPFYAPFSEVRNLEPNVVDTIRPFVTYTDAARIPLIEDFEIENHQFQTVRQGPEIELFTDGGFEGQSARIHLDTINPAVEIGSNFAYAGLTDLDIRVYLEVNYKSDVPVIFGLAGINAGLPGFGAVNYQVGFTERSDWNKIYFNLSGITAQGQFDAYRVIFFSSIIAADGSLITEEADIWLDNIKLVHF
jgi:hypothetical protein